jgi:pyruvate formate-lyase activating enzyme-like uncharacterized protein
MKKINSWLNESAYTAPLSPACKMCAEGAKLVVLVTGLCSARCFYCPISFRKGGKDVVFADEWELDDENDTGNLVYEAEYIEATGAGITGGDPLMVWKRAQRYISLLKDEFGSDFHIHLYTSCLQNADHVEDLVSVGLDEIRFHPTPNYWGCMEKNPITSAIKNALKLDVDVALEIPSIPGMDNQMFALVKWADDNGVRWVNLNELEFSERNADFLNQRKFVVKNDVSAAVKDSQESALDVLKMASEKDLDVGVHYCSSSFKDGVQLTNRIKRRACNVARPYDVITDEGTFLKGVIEIKRDNSLQTVYKSLKKEFDLKDGYIFLNEGKNRIEIALWVLEKIAMVLRQRGFMCYMVEEYPTADGLEVERTPLPL